MIKKITIGTLTIGTYASGFLLEKHQGFGMSSVRVDMKDRGHYHGANFGYAYYGQRVMTIDGEMVGLDVEDYENKRQLLAENLDILRKEQVMLIESHTGKVYRTKAIINDSVEMPYEKGKMIRGKFQVTLVAELPFFFSTEQKTGEVEIYEGGGFAIPFVIDLPIDQGEDTTSILANDGNGYAYPIIKVYGGCTNPTIKNNATGQEITIDHDLSGSDVIEIDTYNRTVLLNGSQNIRNELSGDWILLRPKNNEVRLSASAADTTARVEFEWRDTYVGI